MEIQNIKEPYVALITGKKIEIQANTGNLGADLTDLGFAPDVEKANVYFLKFKDTADRIRLMVCLRDIGVPFSYGPGWAPSEIFEYLRNQGELAGKYRRVLWKGRGDFVISEE